MPICVDIPQHEVTSLGRLDTVVDPVGRHDQGVGNGDPVIAGYITENAAVCGDAGRFGAHLGAAARVDLERLIGQASRERSSATNMRIPPPAMVIP